MEAITLQMGAGVAYKGLGNRYYSTNFELGDVVMTSYNYSNLPRNENLVVSGHETGSTYDVYGRLPDSDVYIHAYPQVLTFQGIKSKPLDARKFQLVRKANVVAALGVSRSTLVQQIKETTATGVYDIVGDIVRFDNMSDAQLYCKKNIQDAIRARNEYPMYRVYEEKFIAQAKEPPVVFE